MKWSWIYVIEFLIYGGLIVYSIENKDYGIAAGFAFLGMLTLAWYVIEELKPKK